MLHRIFTSFAIEDVTLRDFLIGQARNHRSPFEFVDMSVKEPWESSWKTRCRQKIKGCDGMLIIVTPNTPYADGQLWEIKCAREEGVPRRGIWGRRDEQLASLPAEFDGTRVVYWSWDNITNWLDTL